MVQRKIYRDTIKGITNPDIRRICRRAGIKRINGLVYEEVRVIIKEYLEIILNNSITYMMTRRAKTINMDDVKNGIKEAGGINIATSGAIKRGGIC